jgi:serine protease
MAETAAHLVDDVIPRVPLRQWVEIVSRLPREAKLLLELPREFADLLRLRPMLPSPAKKKNNVYVLLNPAGRTRFEEAAFPAKARIPMRLLAAIPKSRRDHAYELYARQLFGGAEVGRVTWRLTPNRELTNSSR